MIVVGNCTALAVTSIVSIRRLLNFEKSGIAWGRMHSIIITTRAARMVKIALVSVPSWVAKWSRSAEPWTPEENTDNRQMITQLNRDEINFRPSAESCRDSSTVTVYLEVFLNS